MYVRDRDRQRESLRIKVIIKNFFSDADGNRVTDRVICMESQLGLNKKSFVQSKHSLTQLECVCVSVFLVVPQPPVCAQQVALVAVMVVLVELCLVKSVLPTKQMKDGPLCAF